jgi:peptide-methionine (S)-S-oxide reductase
MKGVWWHTEEQQSVVEAKVAEIEGGSGRKVVSHHGPIGNLYRAEEYHQNYFAKQGRY